MAALRKLVNDASKCVGENAAEAISTVPAYCADAQRRTARTL
ncbi:Hsp70 family protein [Amycolatopsis thermoflava]|nr:Hsp70 family protein [Amycolatopsis thermoflava]